MDESDYLSNLTVFGHDDKYYRVLLERMPPHSNLVGLQVVFVEWLSPTGLDQ